MGMIEKKSFDSPDSFEVYPDLEIRTVELNGELLSRFVYRPGWRWSQSVKPTVGTDFCQARHFGILISGKMRTVAEDGSEEDIEAGEAVDIQPGHDAWVVGDEPAVFLDFGVNLR